MGPHDWNDEYEEEDEDLSYYDDLADSLAEEEADEGYALDEPDDPDYFD